MGADVQNPVSSHDEHAHSPHLAHHFDNATQQFDSVKLGMWLFLATEILLFGGLFCAYAVYRANHPEIFFYAYRYLSKFWGGVNTVILIGSSFTMAMAVRHAQTGNRPWLIICLALTLLGGFGFLGIKSVEYKAKWQHGLLYGAHYKPTHEGDHGEVDPNSVSPHSGGKTEGKATHSVVEGESANPSIGSSAVTRREQPVGSKAMLASGTSTVIETTGAGTVVERSEILPAGEAPEGLASVENPHEWRGDEPKNVQTFFSIYFAMTGLHGIHVIVGMLGIAWMLVRAIKGEFGPDYFTPVDLVGLYWHLVDLIWIYLFPLLYLIH